MSTKEPLDLAAIRERLASRHGVQYWRSLEEIADTDAFRDLLQREFPRAAEVWDDGFSRRGFLKLMGASLALAGFSGCIKQPDEKIIPYVRQPEIVVPGKPLYFATAVTRGGYGHGVLVTSHLGRPTKIEGNPDHPGSRGATDAMTQASILSLYDPDRSQVVLHNGEISTWEIFLDALRRAMDIQKRLNGAGLRVLTGAVTSPTLGSQLRTLLEEFPQARWHQYDAVNMDNEREGSMLAFGSYLQTHYHFDRARIILSLDADFLGEGHDQVRHARDFAAGRRPGTQMTRLYAAESTPTITGGKADHRFRMRAGEVEGFARALASALGMSGVTPGRHPVGSKSFYALVKELQSARGACVVVAGAHQPPLVHALAHAMNRILGGTGTTVTHTDIPEIHPVNHTGSLKDLVADMQAGTVDVLMILGGNPLYDAPADIDIAGALAKVGMSVHAGLHPDETSASCVWHLPASHSLECWSDTRAFDGTTTIIQPLILPLYNTRSSHEILGEMLGQPGRKGYDIVQDYWKTEHSSGDFELFWRTSLNNGVVAGTPLPERLPALTFSAGASPVSSQTSGMEIIFRADPALWDGSFANNGWLQELPHPVTKVTWDNAAYLSPADASRLALTNEDVVRLVFGGRTLDAPVWIVPGHPDGSVTLHLGYGRTRAGNVGTGVGANANILRTSAGWFGSGLELTATGRTYPVACTQDHSSMEGRPIVRTATLREYNRNPDFAKEMGHVPSSDESLYPSFAYDTYAWGLSIDLNACTGCNACVVACQSENNIPVVGKEQVLNAREMHWIRIDRYYEGDLDDPVMHTQPVMCMHCESAPCEPVCPVAATTHDSEGLNVMTYNRCVGTRYCSNNCPYKVRRFNFLQFSDTKTETLAMMRNPDVTVRNRGVMEKCTYCVQRISAARIEAKKEDRPIRDGEVVTACQAVCPAQAITFGDINNKESHVAKVKADPRNYGLLAELNTRPRTSYLAKVTNPNPELTSHESTE